MNIQDILRSNYNHLLSATDDDVITWIKQDGYRNLPNLINWIVDNNITFSNVVQTEVVSDDSGMIELFIGPHFMRFVASSRHASP